MYKRQGVLPSRNLPALARPTQKSINHSVIKPGVWWLPGSSKSRCHRLKTLEKDGALSPGGEFGRSPNNNSPTPSLSEPVSNTFTSIRRAVFKGLDSSLNSERESATQSSIDWMYASDNDTAYDSGNGSNSSNDNNNGSSHNATMDTNGSSSSIHHNTNKETGSRAVYNTLRIDPTGNTRRIYVKKRDLIRQYKLQPRDLRRMDPSLSAGHRASSPSLTVKENCVLINTCGVRAIIDAEKVILFESDSFWARRFQELVIPGLQAAAERAAVEQRARRRREKGSSKGGGKRGDGGGAGGPEAYLSDGSNGDYGDEDSRQLPFELQMVEGALLVATGRLDDEMDIASRKVQSTLQKLPKEITPLNLEELRKVKQILVQLESRAEGLRDMLEELMDDEDELIELNLSSRPVREERRRQRERERLEREATATFTKILKDPENNNSKDDRTSTNSSIVDNNNMAYQFPGSTSLSSSDRQQLASSLSSSSLSQVDDTDNNNSSSNTNNGPPSSTSSSFSSQSQSQSATAYLEEDAQENYQDALEEMEDEDAEEEEMEEIEDLLEYYLQRAATTQSTAERLLADARDLEESIGVSLSARRFEVNRLELLLSIASFAAALGAMVASIFGMNLRSTLEMSVIGFWGTTGMIVVGSAWVFWVLFRYTKYKRIL